ncbi:MAG: DNA gyrase C-terminal beta-propeller domain-containing protein [Chloroflexota bacterium]
MRGRGAYFLGKLVLPENDPLAVIIPEQAEGYLALVSSSGFVRSLRHHVFGEYMKPGLELYKAAQYGQLAAACWTPGNGDLFIATRQGKAIRFSEKLIPPTGAQGIRMTDGDEAIGIAPVYDESSVFLLSADGRGTLRVMSNFTPNKAPGAGGKQAINNDQLIAALGADGHKDAIIISRLSKIIRFSLEDIPRKDSVVQGVILMSLRADEPVAATLA